MAVNVFNISPQLPNIASRFIRQIEAKAGTNSGQRGGNVSNELLKTLKGKIQQKRAEGSPVKNLRTHIERIAAEGAQVKGEIIDLVT